MESNNFYVHANNLFFIKKLFDLNEFYNRIHYKIYNFTMSFKNTKSFNGDHFPDDFFYYQDARNQDNRAFNHHYNLGKTLENQLILFFNRLTEAMIGSNYSKACKNHIRPLAFYEFDLMRQSKRMTQDILDICPLHFHGIFFIRRHLDVKFQTELMNGFKERIQNKQGRWHDREFTPYLKNIQFREFNYNFDDIKKWYSYINKTDNKPLTLKDGLYPNILIGKQDMYLNAVFHNHLPIASGILGGKEPRSTINNYIHSSL